MPLRITTAEGLAEKVINCGDCRCAQESLQLPFFYEAKNAGGIQRVRAAIEQDIKDDVGIYQDPHRCFFTRCRL